MHSDDAHQVKWKIHAISSFALSWPSFICKDPGNPLESKRDIACQFFNINKI